MFPQSNDINVNSDLRLLTLQDSSAQNFLAAFEALPDALYLFDEDKRLTHTNPLGLRLNGQTESLGKRCCEMFWVVEGADECVVDRAMAGRSRVEVELPVDEHNTRHTLLVVQPIGDENHDGAIVVARDITELRHAEAAAIEHKSFMASVADRTPDEIYKLDTDGRIIWTNERAEKAQLLMLAGRYFEEFISAEARDLMNENLRRTLSGEETQFEVHAVRTDGLVRDVEAHTSPLWRDGEVTGVLVFLRDVTERKRAQELMAQSDKLRAVGELAAGVAHNLNNSLTVIKGRAQLLQMRAKDESMNRSLQVISDAVEDGAKTLRRILEFARRDDAHEFAPVELNDLIATSVEIARPKWQSKTARENGTEIEVKIERNRALYVMGEPAELREVALNLIFNAVDAMPQGGVMEVGARAVLDTGCFWVADTGCGMSAETAARIFEPFYTTKGEKGTGLGLSASHGIIMRHLGEIMVASEPGEGTRFEVRLPLRVDDARFIKRDDDDAVNEGATVEPDSVVESEEVILSA